MCSLNLWAMVCLGYHILDILIRLFLFKTSKVCLICSFCQIKRSQNEKKKIVHLNGIKMYMFKEFLLIKCFLNTFIDMGKNAQF